MNTPADLRYAKSHEWVRMEKDRATVGITDHAQTELSDVVFVDLPKPGRKVNAGEVIATVESVKAASDIYAPVGGRDHRSQRRPRFRSRSDQPRSLCQRLAVPPEADLCRHGPSAFSRSILGFSPEIEP